MQTTTTTTKIAVASILVILVGLVLYVATKSDGVTNTDANASSTVSTSTDANNASNNSGSNTTEAGPGQVMTVTPKQNPLGGTSWIWQDTSYSNKATSVVPGNTKFVITFGTDGAITSSTDCNSVAGRYAVNNDRINIASLTSTLMACEGVTLEAEYVKQLSLVTNYVIESLNNLNLHSANNASTMSFKRR